MQLLKMQMLGAMILAFTLHLRFGHAALIMRTPSDIPNPMIDPKACGRDSSSIRRSAVCDPDHLFKKNDADIIEGYINAISKAQIGVLIIKKMVTRGYSSENAAAKVFATATHNSWGIGSADSNNGILIFLSIEDRVIYISTGTGVMDRITASTVDSLIRLMKPSLRQLEYGVAVQNSIIQIDLTLSGNANAENMRQISGSAYERSVLHLQEQSEIGRAYGGGGRGRGEEGTWADTFLTVAAFGSVIGVAAYLGYRQNKQMRDLERGRAALDRLMREIPPAQLPGGGGGTTPGLGAPFSPGTGSSLGGGSGGGLGGVGGGGALFLSQSCPICLEDFPTATSTTSTETVKEKSTHQGSSYVHVHSDVADIDMEDLDTTPSAPLLPGHDQEYGVARVTMARTGMESNASPNTSSSSSSSSQSSSSLSSSPSSSPGAVGGDGSRPMALRCGHTFCHGCLETYLRSEGGNNCPICRMPVEEDGPGSRRGGSGFRPSNTINRPSDHHHHRPSPSSGSLPGVTERL
jgi:uncharacterized membrane protein YgcG